MSAGAWVRGASSVLLLSVIALSAMTLKAVREGQAELDASDLAFNQGDLAAAVLHARRSATAYAPGAPHTRAALARLRAVAVGAEAAGDVDSARLAWGAIRAAALETRHVTLPYEPELAEANQRLERLALRTAPQDDQARERAEQRIRTALERLPGPAAWASALLVTGFGLSLGGLAFVAVRALTRDGRVLARPLGLGLTLFALGALCWSVSVYFA